MNALRSVGRSVAGLLAASLVLVACSTGAGASVPPSGAPSQGPSAEAPSAPPNAVVTSPPNVGGDPGGAGGGPADGFVVAKPGQLDLHPVAIDSFAARVDGTNIVVTVTWTSGVEPCNTLDHILVDAQARTYAITIFEGHGPEQVACIEIAQIKKTEVSIPVGKSGSYTLVDGQGRATPLELQIP